MSPTGPEFEPQLQREKPGLLEGAPGLRNLALAAALLSVAAIVLPLAVPDAPNPPAAPPPAAATAAPPAPPAATVPAVVQPDAGKTAKPAAPQVIYVPQYIPAPAPSAPATQAARSAPAPAVLPAEPDAQACGLTLPPMPTTVGVGTVIGFEARSLSLARIPRTQQQAGGPIDPDYIDNPRVTIRLDNGETVSDVAPKSMAVQIGDRVTVQGPHRNMAKACNYVPPLITADLGSAKPPAP